MIGGVGAGSALGVQQQMSSAEDADDHHQTRGQRRVVDLSPRYKELSMGVNPKVVSELTKACKTEDKENGTVHVVVNDSDKIETLFDDSLQCLKLLRLDYAECTRGGDDGELVEDEMKRCRSEWIVPLHELLVLLAEQGLMEAATKHDTVPLTDAEWHSAKFDFANLKSLYAADQEYDISHHCDAAQQAATLLEYAPFDDGRAGPSYGASSEEVPSEADDSNGAGVDTGIGGTGEWSGRVAGAVERGTQQADASPGGDAPQTPAAECDGDPPGGRHSSLLTSF